MKRSSGQGRSNACCTRQQPLLQRFDLAARKPRPLLSGLARKAIRFGNLPGSDRRNPPSKPLRTNPIIGRAARGRGNDEQHTPLAGHPPAGAKKPSRPPHRCLSAGSGRNLRRGLSRHRRQTIRFARKKAPRPRGYRNGGGFLLEGSAAVLSSLPPLIAYPSPAAAPDKPRSSKSPARVRPA